MASLADKVSTDDDERPDVDVESEEEDKSIKIIRPFDPERIKVRTIPIVVELLISRIKHREIDLAPDFQRLRLLWQPQRKSRLIESLLLRIPIPVFYVAEDKNENWAVVDGVQRISTIYDFVTGEFVLTDLEYLTELNKKNFDGLPRPMQRRINETQFVFNVIEPGTPDEVMFNIFSRINTGGLRLNGQEIRHALHKGPVRRYLKELADTQEFAEATDHSIKKERMADRECVLRFLSFYIDSFDAYIVNDLDAFLGKAMRRINSMTVEQRLDIKTTFKKAMKAASDISGKDAFRKRLRSSRRVPTGE